MPLENTTDVLSKIPAGVIYGATSLEIFGLNTGPTTSFETVWRSSNAYTFLAANMSSPTIVSSSASDAAAGTGARTVRIAGVNTSFAAVTEDITLNGTTPVSLVGSYMTINSMTVLTAGSGGVAAGNITIDASAVTHGSIFAGVNYSQSFVYCVPAGYGLLMYNIIFQEEAASAGGNRGRIVYSTNKGLLYEKFILGGPTNFPIEKGFNPPLYFPEKTQLQAQFLSAAATSSVTASASCVLLDISATTPTGRAKWI